jgi:hypothetical protein
LGDEGVERERKKAELLDEDFEKETRSEGW